MRRWGTLGLGTILLGIPTRTSLPELPSTAVSAAVSGPRVLDEYQQTLETLHQREQSLIKDFRAPLTKALVHTFEHVPRDVTVLYDAATGDSLDAVVRFPDEPRYDLVAPEPARACALIGKSTPKPIAARIVARETELESAGREVLSLNGRASDFDCLATRSLDFVAALESSYWSRDIPGHIGHVIQESMLNANAQSRDRRGRPLAQGMFQILKTHNAAFAKQLKKQGWTYDWQDPVMQSWLASAMLAVEAKRKGSVLLAKSAYHNGYNTRFALQDGIFAFDAVGEPQPGIVEQFLVGSELAYRLWQDKDLRKKLGTQFGTASYRYVLEDALYNAYTDSVSATQGVQTLVPHIVTKPATVSSLAARLGATLEDVALWNPALFKNGKPVPLTKGRFVYAPDTLHVAELQPLDYLKTTSARAACQQQWRALPVGQWEKPVGESLATCFADAGDDAMAFALRTSSGTVSPIETAAIARYTSSVARQQLISSLAPMLIPRLRAIRGE